MSDLTIGQTLYYVPNRNRGGGEAQTLTVTKLGRKWATCAGERWGEYRIDRYTLQADGQGYSIPGRCYLSVELYQSELERDKAWQELRQRMQYGGPPDSLTTGQIRNFLGLLS